MRAIRIRREYMNAFKRVKLKVRPFPLKLDVIFEDAHLAVIRKPAGIVVSANNYRNIKNALPHNLSLSDQIDALESPLPCHRLDKETQGLLLIGKTHSCLTALNQLFQERKIVKTYHAVAHGILLDGIITDPIDDKEAHTSYEVVNTYKSLSYDQLSLVKLNPKSGRRHQLRKHLLSIGNSILGDPAYYGDHKRLYKKGMFLCATALQFKHPKTNEILCIKTPIPRKFIRILENEARRWEKFQS